MRKVLQSWYKDYVKIGKLSEWKKAVKDLKVSNLIKGCSVYIDSSDFKIRIPDKFYKGVVSWSYKCYHTGIRYMVICDFKTKVLYISHRYTPKLYDSH